MTNSFKSVWVYLYEVLCCVVLSSFRLSRSCLTFSCSVVGFFCCTNFLCWRLTAQCSSTMLSLAHDGSPSIAGPGVSAMFHRVHRHYHLDQCQPCTSGFHIDVVQSQQASPLLQRLQLQHLFKYQRCVYCIGITVRWCLQDSCNTHLITVVVFSSNFTNLLGFSPFSLVGMSLVLCSFLTASAIGLSMSQFSTSWALVFPSHAGQDDVARWM